MTDTDQLATRLLDAARARGIMIITAESCTGGRVAAALTDIPGSSDVFERGFVTYSNAAKSELLGVPPHIISAHGAVSQKTAHAMAEGALKCAPAACLAVSVTGIAGPGGGTEEKPEGLVWFAVALTGTPTATTRRTFGAIGRAHVREKSTQTALELALAQIS